MSDDRRASPRAVPAADCPVWVRVLLQEDVQARIIAPSGAGQQQGEEVLASVVDISEGGIGLYLPASIEAIAELPELTMSLRLPEVDPFDLVGVIVSGEGRSRGNIAVEFTSIPNSGVQAIRSYVNERVERASAAARELTKDRPF